jgi:hypothetical protein
MSRIKFELDNIIDNFIITPEMQYNLELDIDRIIDRLNVFPTFKGLLTCLHDKYTFDEIWCLMETIENYYIVLSDMMDA